MKNLLRKMKGNYVTSAKVVDGTLILSAPDAVSPVVWRWDLAQVASSALEIKESKDNGYILALKTPKGEVCEVAPFDNRDKAMVALMAVSRAMEGAQGHIKAANSTPKSASTAEKVVVAAPEKQKNELVQWLIAIFGVLGIVALFFYLMTVSPETASTGYVSSSSSVNGAANPKESTGVPVSADDFLGGM